MIENGAGEIIATIVVLQLPPNESYKRRVNFESLYGICLVCPVTCYVSAEITFPNALKLLLIDLLSSNRIPVACDTLTL